MHAGKAAALVRLRFYRTFLAVVILALLGGSACASEPRVTLHTASGDVAVAVEIADTPERRALGLMYRKELGADRGMLFVFDAPEILQFWMKNTQLPLDMIFIGDDRRVVGVVENAVPFTTTSRGVGKPSRYVLEVNAGFGARHKIAAGDEVRFENVPGVATAPAPTPGGAGTSAHGPTTAPERATP
jgi:uncharacterized membrane protein (UPF0127 family)